MCRPLLLCLIAFAGFILGPNQPSIAQENSLRQANRALFNRIEYFIQLGETDSVYHLGSSAFKEKVSLESFKVYIREHISRLGHIKQARAVNFVDSTQQGHYIFEFDSARVGLKLTSASERSFSEFVLNKISDAQAVQGKPADTRGAGGAGNTRVGAAGTQVSIQDNADFADIRNKVDALATAYMEKVGRGSLSIGLMNRNSQAQYSFEKPAGHEVATPFGQRQFHLGSGKHPLTATLLALLSIENLIDVDSPIATYLPESLGSNQNLQKITLTQLANHSAGFPLTLPASELNAESDADLNADLNASAPNDTTAKNDRRTKLLHYLSNFNPMNEIGVDYAFSDLGYEILELIISEHLEVPFDDLLQKKVIVPLGLENTLLLQNDDSNVGDWVSNLTDMMRFARAHFNSPDTPLEHALAYTRQFSFFLPPDTDVGLSWKMKLLGDNLIYWHEGLSHDGKCVVCVSPDVRKALVLFAKGIPENGATIDGANEGHIMRLAEELMQILLAKK